MMPKRPSNALIGRRDDDLVSHQLASYLAQNSQEEE